MTDETRKTQTQALSISNTFKKAKRQIKSADYMRSYHHQIQCIFKNSQNQAEQSYKYHKLKKRGSFGGDFKGSYSQIQDVNMSSIKNKKQKSQLGRFRMLIDKSKHSNRKEQKKRSQTKKCSFFSEANYKTIHDNFLTCLRQTNKRSQQDDEQIDEALASKTPTSLPTKGPQYFRNQISKIRNSSTIISTKDDSLETEVKQLEEQYHRIARTIDYEQKESPGSIIYNHFSNKYRDYFNIKRQMKDMTGQFTRLFNEQNKILQRMNQNGVSEQNKFRIISQFQNYMVMMGNNREKPEMKSNPQIKTYTQKFGKSSN